MNFIITTLLIIYCFGLFKDEDGVDRIHQDDREAVKRVIVDMMLVSPEAVQKQLSDAVSIIGRTDFPEKWPNLISDMVEKFASGRKLVAFVKNFHIY